MWNHELTILVARGQMQQVWNILCKLGLGHACESRLTVSVQWPFAHELLSSGVIPQRCL